MKIKPEARFPNIAFYLTAAIVSSFLFSLFLLQIFSALLFILWLFEKNDQKKISFDLLGKAILAFGIVRIAALIFSEYPSESVLIFTKEILFYLSFFALNYYLKSFDEKKLHQIINIFVYAGVAISLIGIFQFVFNYVHRAQSITSGYATFSSYLIIIFIFLYYQKINTDDIKLKLIWIASVSFVLTGIIVSQGRANIAIAGLAFIVITYLNKTKLKYAAAIIFSSAALSIGSFFFNSTSIQSRISNVGALSDRDILLKGFKLVLGEYPIIGFGPLTFKKVFPFFDELADKGVGSWHNLYIEIYIESGVIGLLSFFALIYIVLLLVYKSFKVKNNSELIQRVSLSVLISTISLLIISLTAGFLFSPILSIVFAFIISLQSSIYYKYSDKPD
ncbi:MAG: hypothetical protein HND52_03090 [Ignavibacteriae bacterium]|nr:hypothetical protein [Ignavibacteriota bacterium]NOG96938.1 hypothetical protein [Ignavibacteriota bacterium]